jgi:membrane protein DedA with SNARE-associated domain
MTEIVARITAWYMGHINYTTITILMAIESSFIPFPSEIIVPPAAFKAAQGELNIYLVILSSTFGAIIGAVFNYLISIWIGRKIIYAFAETRFAHILMIEPKSIQKAESYFVKHGNSSTFIGRLVPGIRQLISIPAGLARMHFGKFILYTMLGSGLWNIVLALLGYYIPAQLVDKYYKELSWAMIILGVAFVLHLVYKAIGKRRKTA